MISTEKFKISPVAKTRLEAMDLNHMEFGKLISDHMLVSDYRKGEWLHPRLFLTARSA